jgi:hypothetical protein
MTITQITHNIGNYIINTDMNIAIDKENKTITLHEGVTLSDLADYLSEEAIEGWSMFTIFFPPEEIQYIPVYPAAPIIPQIVTYPVYPYPVYPSPTPYYPP